MPRRVRSGAFDLDRPDVDIDQPAAMPSPQPGLASLLPPRESAVAASVGSVALPPKALRPPNPVPVQADPSGQPSTPRGVGGRPLEPVGITAVPARVPTELYEAALPLVKGVGRPSWGQLVAWTCQDHSEAVKAELRSLAESAAAPRRLRGVNRAGSAALQVTARVSPEELSAVEAVRGGMGEGVVVTRTMVVNAALRVATVTEAETEVK